MYLIGVVVIISVVFVAALLVHKIRKPIRSHFGPFDDTMKDGSSKRKSNDDFITALIENPEKTIDRVMAYQTKVLNGEYGIKRKRQMMKDLKIGCVNCPHCGRIAYLDEYTDVEKTQVGDALRINCHSCHKDMLVLDTGDGQVRVALPEEWTVGTDVVAREMLFGSSYLTQGENVTVKALRTNLFEKTAFSIYFLIGYEIVDDAGVQAYAAMPINIET